MITNDDIKSSPFTGFGGVFYTNTGSINDCDATCFERVHMFAHVTGEKNATWRRAVLEQLDAVRSDSEWQTYLHELYGAHRKVCQVTFHKVDELICGQALCELVRHGAGNEDAGRVLLAGTGDLPAVFVLRDE